MHLSAFLGGLWNCYRASAGADNRNFVERYVCLGISGDRIVHRTERATRTLDLAAFPRFLPMRAVALGGVALVLSARLRTGETRFSAGTAFVV
jgi:hypothetical protein